MKSKAHIKGHPLHPILVGFPIAFFVGTLFFDVLGLVYDRNDFHSTAMYLLMAGLAFALLAAIPGVIDFVYVVPPKSSAKKRAIKHALINIIVLAIFGLALLARTDNRVSIGAIIGLEIAGVVLLGIAGWLGGTLVYRNQIGVDIRYAYAGKWKEEYKNVSEANGEVVVAGINELKVNQMKLVHIQGKRIVICKTEKGYTAFDDRCPHRGGSLAAGSMICRTVQCPWHGSQFDVHTGRVMAGPAEKSINTYPVRTSGTNVFLVLSNEHPITGSHS
ncbi:DUF2231 domain-containing protein [Terrimonas alba]|uniref:DUF2231 domain-containing protein n=1 Tax=Terrimonas alba TaxID=3349636 RepID=UPI0035F451BA